MDDYISREAAIRAAMKDVSLKRTHEFNGGCARAANNIKAVPAADVRPVKRGNWIMHISDLFPADSTMECDQCHEEQPIVIDDNFCPNCGADMREEQHG